MPVFESQRLGSLAYDSESTIEFPRGLPGFDHRRAFVAVHLPGADPLVFLQSLEDPALCFITAPVAAIGVALGLAAAFGVTRLLASLLYGIKAADPMTFAGVALAIGLVTLAASYIPALRAAATDPNQALRHE